MNNEYNGYFFNEFQRENGGTNYMDSGTWEPYFKKVAKRIVDLFNPTTVLDAGCACGYLVAALRDLGVEAYGIDVSKYALGFVREDVRPYCVLHSVTEALPAEMPQTYDVVVAAELLEYLFPDEGELAIKNLCSYGETVVFSSTFGVDVTDRSYVNVQLPEYWAELFFGQSFAKNFISDLSVVSPWCVAYEKFADVKKLIFHYERNMRIDKLENEKNIDSTIEDVMNSLLTITSRVYFDSISGFLKEKSILVTQKLEDSVLTMTVPIPEDTLSLRFDPMEGENCMLRDVEMFLDHQPVTSFSTNGEIVENYIFFHDLEPHIILEGVQDKKEFKITCKFQFVEDEFKQFYHAKNQKSLDSVAEFKDNLEESEKSVSSLEDELAEVVALVAEKEKQLAQRSSEVLEQADLVRKKETVLSEKESIIAQKDTALMEYAGKITQKDALVTQKEKLIEELESQLAEKEAQIASLDVSKTSDLEEGERESLASSELQALREQISELEEVAGKVSQLEKTIREKEAAINRRNADLESKEKLIGAKDDLLAEKETMIQGLDQELYKKNTKVASLESNIHGMEAACDTLTEQNKLINEQLDKVMASHEAMLNSSAWKLVAPFYKEPVDEDKKSKGKKDSKSGKKTKDMKEDKKSSKDGKESKGKKEKDSKVEKDSKNSKDKKKEKDVKGKDSKGKKEASDKKGKKEASDKKGKKDAPDKKGKKDVSDKKGKKDVSGKKAKKKSEDEDEDEDTFLGPDESILEEIPEKTGKKAVVETDYAVEEAVPLVKVPDSEEKPPVKKKVIASMEEAELVEKVPVPENDAAVGEKKATVGEKKAPVGEKKATVVEEKAVVVEKKATVVTKKAAVVEKKAAVVEKKAPVVAKKAPVVAKKAAVVAKKAPVVAKKEATSEEKSPVKSPVKAVPKV